MSGSRYEQLLQTIVNQSKQEEGKTEFAEGVFTQHNMKETSVVSRALVITEIQIAILTLHCNSSLLLDNVRTGYREG